MTDDNLRARLAHVEDRLKRIEQAETATDDDGREWSVPKLVEMGLTRRQAMLAVGSLAVYGGSIWGAIKYATGNARAATDQAGTTGQRVDVFADTVDAVSIDTGRATIGGRSAYEKIGEDTVQGEPDTELVVSGVDSYDIWYCEYALYLNGAGDVEVRLNGDGSSTGNYTYWDNSGAENTDQSGVLAVSMDHDFGWATGELTIKRGELGVGIGNELHGGRATRIDAYGDGGERTVDEPLTDIALHYTGTSFRTGTTYLRVYGASR